MSQVILHKRGLEVNLPVLQASEIAFTTDTQKLFVGTTASGNLQLAKISDLADLATKTELGGKANATHTHVLTDLTDVDVTSKVNGHALQYDSVAGKFVSKALPAATQITDSTTNGNILVDGVEVTVFEHPASHPATMITEDSTHRFVTDAEKTTWTDKYTKNEVDNKISAVTSSMDWKESVATFADLATTYPSPVDGWTVNVQDNDYTYRYDSTSMSWVTISANSIPLATTSVDGKMAAADKSKLDGIEAGANNYIHPASHAATMITQDTTHRFVTDDQIATWNAAASATTVDGGTF